MSVQLSISSYWHQQASIPLRYQFDLERVRIGRGMDTDVQLPHASVSLIHAYIEHDERGYTVIDQGGTNTTRLNGKALVAFQPIAIKSGDRLTISGFNLELHCDALARHQDTQVAHIQSLAQHMMDALLSLDAPEQVTKPHLLRDDQHKEEVAFVLDTQACREWRIGRDPDCEWPVAHVDLAPHHGTLTFCDTYFTLSDAGSKLGIYVNDEKISHQQLQHEDRIRMGPLEWQFRDPMTQRLNSLMDNEDETLDPAWIDAIASAASDDTALTEPKQKKASVTIKPKNQEKTTLKGRTKQTELAETNKATPAYTTETMVYILAGCILCASVAGLCILFF